MAEAALLLVITKIGIAVGAETLNYARPLLAKKSDSVAALPNDMRLIQNELELMQAFLEDTNRKGCTDRVKESWIGQARRLAYDMEDVVDQFIYVVGKHHQKGKGSCWSYVKKIVKKPQSLFTLDQIATAIIGINQQLTQLKQNKDYWIQPIGGVPHGHGIPATNYDSQYVPGQDYPIADDELVGFDINKTILTEVLSFEGCSRLRFIALWGMGGIGKSTLVNNLYRNEASKFDCHAWVSVSHSYIMEDIWRNLLIELCTNKEKCDADYKNSIKLQVGKLNSAELQVELKKILEKKRFLIVLDDVWKAQDLLQIKKVLVDNGLGSRAITTTRSEEVASIADDGCQIKVEPLCDDDAWHLFCRKAFPRTENHICPPELHQCGKDIVGKCGGLPLALVAIGSILSLKVQNFKEWRLFYKQLNWELHNNENLTHVEKILNLSYKYLPNNLKSCFLYCAMFPEDYWIQRDILVRLWTAEGFVERRGEFCLEEVAEDYLRELVRRSMLHVVERDRFGGIWHVQMHDIVRELAISQSKKEFFGTTYDDTHVTQQLSSDCRRVSVLRCKSDIRSSIHPSRLRTFIAFDTMMESSSWFPSESKYLAVLELSGLPIDIVPDSVGELFNLKYLGLDRTNVKKLPESVTKLHNLETLSLRDGQCLNLPRGSKKLKRLRHILINKMLDGLYGSFISYESVESFEGLWDLKELQTLRSVRASTAFVAKLGNLSQLRLLLITEVRSSQCAQFCHSVSKLQHLSRIEIRASNEDEVLQLDSLTLPNPLDMLTLIGRLSEGTLESPLFSTHGNALLRLELYWSRLSQNPLPRLSKLANLRRLVLAGVYIGQVQSFIANDSELSSMRELSGSSNDDVPDN